MCRLGARGGNIDNFVALARGANEAAAAARVPFRDSQTRLALTLSI